MILTNLKKIRTKKGLTQQQVADGVGIDRVTYTNYELGKRTPDADVIKNLSIFFNVTADYILGNTNKPDRLANSELKKLGFEWISVAEEFRASGLTPEQIKNLLEAIKATQKK